MSTRILVTGGAGFIGSHTCLALLEAGYDVVVIDDFSNGSRDALDAVRQYTGRPLSVFYGDIRNPHFLDTLFSTDIHAVIHFAGLKAVGESVQKPLEYWDVNVNGTRTVLSAMERHECKRLVFSSSATVYGTPDSVPINENAPIRPANPYGNTKAAVEKMLEDVAADGSWGITSLRYFNPVGAHPSGVIGESPVGVPNNLFPFVSQVATGERKLLNVFGGDWPTFDGTCIRDYIHVMDLAEGHLAALDFLFKSDCGYNAVNLGSGVGHSVLDVIKAFEAGSSRPVPYKIVERRPGDVAVSVADPFLAKLLFGWATKRSLADMCRDSWAWQSATS